jgi:hypothetical protein
VKRARHYLRRNVSSRRPSRLIFLDCDSDVERLDNGDERETFKSAAILTVRRRKHEYVSAPIAYKSSGRDSIWAIIESQACKRARVLVVLPKPVRVLTLLDHVAELTARGWTLADPVSSSRFTAIAWRKDSRTLLFISHGNLFPMQRLTIGDAADTCQQMCATWLEYLRLLDEQDVGDFHLSLGAQAMGIFRHKFLQHPILIHADKRADELEVRACMGALYQPYWSGEAPKGEYFYLDTNAMYPAMMATHLYPWRLAGITGRCTPWLLRKRLGDYSVIATLTLRTGTPRYPARVDGRTIYPVGEFSTTLATPDLLNALRMNHIVGVHALAWYDRADLFSGFVKHFWRLRGDFNSHGKPLWAAWAKSMMVALYGRFGAHIFETRDEGPNPLDHDGADQMASLDNGEMRWYHTLSGRMWSSGRVGLHLDSFPAIMAHVAAYGRNRMFGLMDQAGWDNVFVVLSDGLIVNARGYKRLQREIQPRELGMLKLKLSGDELEIRSDVEFRLADHTWLPGVKRDALEIEDGVFVEHLDPNLAGAARLGDAEGYVRRASEVRLARQIRTGQVAASGAILPLRLAQLPLAR